MTQNANKSWQKQLKSSEELERKAAIKTLGIIKPNNVGELLIGTLASDQSDAVRATAAKVLGQLHNEELAEEIAEALFDALQQPSSSVRAAAASALGKSQPAGTLAQLHLAVEREQHVAPNALLAVVKALGKMLNADSIDYLRPLAHHTDEAVQGAVRKALGKFGLSIEAITQQRAQINSTLHPTSLDDFSSTQQLLLETMYGERDRQAAQAAVALGKSGNPIVLDPLIRSSTAECNHAIRLLFEAIDEPDERLAHLRSMMHPTLPKEHLWMALCTVVDHWPADELEIILSYIGGHIATWPDKYRDLSFGKVKEYLQGQIPQSTPLVRAAYIPMWGELQPTQELLRSLPQSPLIQQLTRIALCGGSIGDKEMGELLAKLPETQIQYLELHRADITTSTTAAVYEYREKLPYLKELSLQLEFQVNDIRALSKHRSMTLITELIALKGWNEQAINLRSLQDALNSQYAENLTSFGIENSWNDQHGVDARGLLTLASTEAWTRLRKLTLTRSFQNAESIERVVNLGHFGRLASIHFDSLNEASKILKALVKQSCPQLKSLWLRSCELENVDIKRLSNWPHLSTIEELDISGNQITFNGYKSLLESKHWCAIKRLRLGHISAREFYSLREICSEHPILSQVELW